MAEVIEVNDLETLEAYRDQWCALFDKTPSATFFQTLDWLKLFWQHFGEGQKLRVLVVADQGQVIGIVPLWVETSAHKLGRLRTLGYPLDAWGNFYGPLGDRPQETLTAAMRHLASTPRDWDRIALDWVSHESTDNGTTERAMVVAGLRPELHPSDVTSMVDLSAGWDAYVATRGPKTRHRLRNNLRQVERDSRVEYIRHRPLPAVTGDGDPRWDLYDLCEQVAERSWQSGSTDGNTLCHPRYRDFYRATHAAAARLGMLDVNVLLVDGRPVAFGYNYVTRGQVTGLRMGYDADTSGAGLLLLAAQLHDSCRRGDELVDLGIGDQPFKQRLRSSTESIYQLTHTPLTAVRSQALRLGHWLRHTATRQAQPA